MEFKLQDFYGQYITINNKTSSGNVRFKVRTTDLNELCVTKEEDCDMETDISLNKNQLNILVSALQECLDKMEGCF